MSSTPKTIQIFLPSGEPHGIRIAEITTRIVQVIEVPRSLLADFLADSSEQGLGTGPQARDVVTDLVLRLAIADAMAAHGDDRGAARPLFHHPLWCRHRPQLPGDVPSSLDFPLAGAPGHEAAVGEPIADQLKPLSAAVFDGNQEVGTALGEVEEKGRLACSASACTSTPSSSTASSSWRRAWISPLLSVA